jgi:uncharacterized membrane protein (DUF106 family)
MKERFSMLKVLSIILGLSALLITANAADNPKPKRQRPPLTEEQKALRKQMTEKYDKNKDGRLDREERQAMSAEDKEKMSKAFGRGQKKKKGGDK